MPSTLVSQAGVQLPAVTVRMRSLGRATRAVEKSVGRMGMWYPQGARAARPSQLALLYEPRRQFGAEVCQITGRALTADHQRIWSEAMSEYLRAGELEARAGSVGAAQLARALGVEVLRSGRVPADVDVRLRRLVQELASAQFRGTFPILEKGAKPVRLTLQLLDSPQWRPGPDGNTHLFFGVPVGMAQLLSKVNQVTFLHAPTWDAIRERDEVAALLWVLIEGERIPPAGWTYPVFSGAEGGILDEARDAVADWLHLSFSQPREMVRRLRKAVECIVAVDSRYAGTRIVRDPRATSAWYLRVLRSDYLRQADDGAVPRSVDAAWRTVHFGREPSAAQRGVLREMVERRGAEWIAHALLAHEGAADPFREVMGLEARLSRSRTREILAAEREADQEKAQEIADAAQLGTRLSGAAARSALMASVSVSTAADTDVDEASPAVTTERSRGEYASRVGELLAAAAGIGVPASGGSGSPGSDTNRAATEEL